MPRVYISKGCYLSPDKARHAVAMLQALQEDGKSLRGYTKALARYIQVSPHTVRDYLRGKCNPSPAVASRIEALYGRRNSKA